MKSKEGGMNRWPKVDFENYRFDPKKKKISLKTNLIASTTTILNSSEISDMKDEICFIRRSTLLSLPVYSAKEYNNTWVHTH